MRCAVCGEPINQNQRVDYTREGPVHKVHNEWDQKVDRLTPKPE
jgi:hypothetical protein